MINEIIRKSFFADMVLVEGERAFIAKITSEAIDSAGDVLLPAGMDATEFEKFPNVYWNHEYIEDRNAVPIGHVVNLKRMPDHWLAKVKLDARPAAHVGEWFPDTVLSKIQQGTIRGVSVGLIVTEKRRPTSRDKATFGEDVSQVVSRWKIRELSVTALPANKEAAILAVSKRDAGGHAAPPIKRVIVLSYAKSARVAPDPSPMITRLVNQEIAKRRGRIYA